MKDIDIFASPVRTYFHRHSYQTDVTKHEINMGTYCGGLVSIVFVTGMITRLISLMVTMESGQLDNIQQLIVTNLFDAESSSINVAKSDFMPYFDMTAQHSSSNPSQFDIWDESKEEVDLVKLRNYFEPVIIYRERKIEKDLRIIKQMRKCTPEDFEKRGRKSDFMKG